MPEVVQANSYASAGAMTRSIFTIYDAGKPQYVQELSKRFGLQFTPFWDWFKRMGREESVAGNGNWFAYQENRYKRELKVYQTVADPGVGNDITFQLDPTYIDTLGNYYGRLHEAVTIPGTLVQAHIIDITGTAPNIYFTLRPIDVSANIGSLTAGTKLAITNGAKADGTGQGKGAVVGNTKKEFKTQIFFDDAGIEGTQITVENWYDAFDANGKKVGIVSDLIAKAQARLNSKINGAYLLGQKNTNTNLVQTSRQGSVNPIQYTEGLIPAITKEGSTMSIPYGTFAIDDLDDVGLYLRTQGVDSNVVLLAVGARRRNEIENAAKSFIQGNGTDLSSAVRSAIIGTDPADKLLSLGFCEIYKGGVHFMLKTIDDFSDPTGLGATGYDMDKTGIIFPLSSMKDPVTGNKLDNICTKYVEKNGYNRRFEMWSEGAAGGDTANYTSEYDERLYHLRSHMGLQLLKVNQMMYIPA